MVDTIAGWQVGEDRTSNNTNNEVSTEKERDNKDVTSEQNVSAPKPSNVIRIQPFSISHPEIIKTLLEIKANFAAQLEVAIIQMKSPDFVFPENEIQGKKKSEALIIWNRIKNKYDYAAKMKELSAEFGRIQSISIELKNLLDQFPDSSSLKRYLSYFHKLLGKQQEAIRLLKDCALYSKNLWDWYNLAAMALSSGQEDLSCYSLQKFFYDHQLNEPLSAWYVFIRLIKLYSNYQALNDLAQTKHRTYSDEESNILFQTGIYILSICGKETIANDFIRKRIGEESHKNLLVELFQNIIDPPIETYQDFSSKFNSEIEADLKSKFGKKQITSDLTQIQGYIYKYRFDRNFGFLRGADGVKYFFHRSAISDDDLLAQVLSITPGAQIPVLFEAAQGPKGPLAIGVVLNRTLDEMFSLASEYTNQGEYPKAIAQIKRVLTLNPDYPNAKECYEKWREYVRIAGVPRGSNPYARAKRVQLVEKDLDRAAQLLKTAISQGDNIESAIKDLAALLAQQGKPEESVEILLKNRKKINDQQSVDNLLIGFYQSAGQYDKAISILQNRLKNAKNKDQKFNIQLQISNLFLRREDYTQAENNLKKLLELMPNHKTTLRKVAFCYFKQEQYEEAQRILEQILNTSPDAQSLELLEAINQVKSGQIPKIDEIVIETTLSDFSREISKFAQFFLRRCDFQGVPPDRVQTKKFEHIDIQKLEDLAMQLGPRRPHDRAAYYLSAAKIVSLQEDEDTNQFYRYLCRSFTSRGDAIVIENMPLDAAREFYSEALSAYDGYRSTKKVEKDASYAFVRFLFSTLGQGQISIKPEIPTIDETIEIVLSQHPDRNKVFEAIAYLTFRSRYAANRILNQLYQKSSLQAMTIEYLKSKGVSTQVKIKRLEDFIPLWNELHRKHFDESRIISNEIRLLNNFELTTAWIENSIEKVKKLVTRLFFDLDRQRLAQLQKILETSLELCKQTTFEEQERFCIQIDNRCQDLLGEIENSPTKYSVEDFYPAIEAIKSKVMNRLEEIYNSSIPQLTLRLPVESYTPDTNKCIEIQIAINNRLGCSPAESLELIVHEDENLFCSCIPEIKLESSLRGGDQHILKIPIQISKVVLESQTFSLPLYAQFRTRSEEVLQTPIQSFSIRLYKEEDFEEIENPYAAYAEGGIVNNSEMFYGRKELIINISKAIEDSRAKSKCFVIFGQKRAGKSSILHHLKFKLKDDKNLLILDVGNIGAILDEHSSSPLFYQILWAILKRLQYAIEDRIGDGFTSIGLPIPSDIEFFTHPSPLILFKDIFEQFNRYSLKLEDWRGSRVVILIDEFSYIYGQIVAGRIPELFMKNWKALLQENCFSAVLAGQDVMPKFKQSFPNEFGTTQDERVSYLRPEDAFKLIDEPIRVGGRDGESRYRERAKERILHLTAGSPFYIQIHCCPR